jgi:surface antigen
MASENESTKLPFNGETGNVRNKGRRNNGKGPNKTPQRGVGVEKLEKMRLQQESFKTFNQQQQQLLFSNYAAFHQFPQQQQVMINNNNNNNNINNVVCSSGFGVGSASASSSSSIGYGWVFRNPFENSSKKDLSSIPNLNHHQSLDLSLKVLFQHAFNFISYTIY